MKRTPTYIALNLLVLFVCLFYLGVLIVEPRPFGHLQGFAGAGYLGLAAMLLIISQAIKALRLNMLLIEEENTAIPFVALYCKTTIVSIIIPAKLGELFRYYSFAYRSKKKLRAIMGVLLDRMSDVLVLIPLFAIQLLSEPSTVNAILAPIMLFGVTFCVAFIGFPSFYRFFNLHLIVKGNGSSSIFLLRNLHVANEVHSTTMGILRSRWAIALFLSAIAWFFDYTCLGCCAAYLRQPFNLSVYGQFLRLGGLNFGAVQTLYSVYLILAGVVLGVVAAGAYVSRTLANTRSLAEPFALN
ncbi:MAG: hypothetical protein JSS72_05580 [Armatimonadetes bacterium]|nr:hypothetical protein [Armatimonadota bacterium]